MALSIIGIDLRATKRQLAAGASAIGITYPLAGAVFPPDIAPPTIAWEPVGKASSYRVTLRRNEAGEDRIDCSTSRVRIEPARWREIVRAPGEVRLRVQGLDARGAVVAEGAVAFRIAAEPVAAPIFYREVNLPFAEAVKDPTAIRWRFGTVDSLAQPPIVLEGLPVCGNCHSFSADGRVLGMDVDYANDKGSYAIVDVGREIVLDDSKIITWSDYRREDGEPTFGLLSQVSPDGRYVVSMVKDRSVFAARPELAFSQLFFPFRGVLAVYDRREKRYFPLAGASDPNRVQSNPAWSPDGRWIAFARTTAANLPNLRDKRKVLLSAEECGEFLRGGKGFQYDLYRVPFSPPPGTREADLSVRTEVPRAEPLLGASANGSSNYFAKYSPDGKWIVFCRSRNYMLLQPDSELWIVPAGGGVSRRLECNTSGMNSWHSFSPNGRWLVFSSKANGPYTQLWLAHLDEQGRSAPAVLLERFTSGERAANIPEFVNTAPAAMEAIRERFLNADSFVRAGNAFLDGPDYAGASRCYRKAISIDANCAEAHSRLGAALLATGDAGAARVHLERAVRLKADDAVAQCDLGRALLAAGRHDAAVASFRRAVATAPDFAQAHFCLSLALAAGGDRRAALEHARRVAETAPEFAEGLLHLGTLLLETGKLAEAADALEKATRIDEGNPRAQAALGLALLGQGKLREADKAYRAALRADERFEPALRGLALVLTSGDDAGLRNIDEAVRLARKACEVTRPAAPESLDALAAVYWAAGRPGDAAAAAEAAIKAARMSGRMALAAAIEKRLQAYRKQATE